MHANLVDIENRAGDAAAPALQLFEGPESPGGQAVWADQLVSRVLDDADRRQTQRTAGRNTSGFPTGIPGLDRVLNGLSPRGLYILGGAPGAGKTSLCLQIACEVARHAPVLYVTFENSPENLVLKAICRLGLVQPGAVERGRADTSRLAEGVQAFSSIAGRMAIVEGTSRTTLDSIRTQAEQVGSKHDTGQCLIIVDYLQRLAVHQEYGSIAENIASISLGLRELASRLDSPIVAISSLSRASNYDTPTLQALQGSEDLEFAADVVLLLGTRQEVSLSSRAAIRSTASARLLDLTVAKNRYGEAGKRVSLVFRPNVGDFVEDTRA